MQSKTCAVSVLPSGGEVVACDNPATIKCHGFWYCTMHYDIFHAENVEICVCARIAEKSLESENSNSK